MRVQVLVSTVLFAATTAQAHAWQSVDSTAWLAGISEAGEGSTVRWRINATNASSVPIPVNTPTSALTDITAVPGQVSLHPFGDEFYLSAGTIAQRRDRAVPAWMRHSDASALAGFPHAELSEELRRSNLDALTRYFGAGITVRTMDAWSITMEGGAYFRDTSEDRLVLFDPDTGTQATLLDDMDDLAGDAVGETLGDVLGEALGSTLGAALGAALVDALGALPRDAVAAVLDAGDVLVTAPPEVLRARFDSAQREVLFSAEMLCDTPWCRRNASVAGLLAARAPAGARSLPSRCVPAW